MKGVVLVALVFLVCDGTFSGVANAQVASALQPRVATAKAGNDARKLGSRLVALLAADPSATVNSLLPRTGSPVYDSLATYGVWVAMFVGLSLAWFVLLLVVYVLYTLYRGITWVFSRHKATHEAGLSPLAMVAALLWLVPDFVLKLLGVLGMVAAALVLGLVTTVVIPLLRTTRTNYAEPIGDVEQGVSGVSNATSVLDQLPTRRNVDQLIASVESAIGAVKAFNERLKQFVAFLEWMSTTQDQFKDLNDLVSGQSPDLDLGNVPGVGEIPHTEFTPPPVPTPPSVPDPSSPSDPSLPSDPSTPSLPSNPSLPSSSGVGMPAAQ